MFTENKTSTLQGQTRLLRISALLGRFEIDRAVAFGILDRIWRLIAGPVTAVLVAAWFTPELQGYYYAFASLLALQVFVELGLGTVIIQFASHEWSKLDLDSSGRIVGDKNSLSRLISLARFTAVWYLVGAFVLTIGLVVVGYFFFSQSHDNAVDWLMPWLSLSILTGITICLVPLWSLLEGCNQVARVYAFRFIQGLCIHLSIWIAILSGAKLWAASVSSIVGLLVTTALLLARYWPFVKNLFFVRPAGPRIKWRDEVLPMQWRIALSWLSGYFTFSLFIPVLFHYHGPVIAGQMGMTWSLVSVVSSLSFVWVNPKAPRFGMLVAQKRYQELDRLLWRLVVIVSAVAALCSTALWGLVFLLYALNHPLSSRLLAPLPTALFLLATVIMVFSFPFSTYLRAHKKEPILILSVITAILIAASNLVLGKYFSANGMAVGYLAVTAIIIPFVILIWHRCRAAWHGEPVDAVQQTRCPVVILSDS